MRPICSIQSERITALKLMEMQRHALLMYTSCGWFFDEISGIETVQIIAYAGRVIQLAAEVFGADAAELEAGFVERLRAAKSNDAEAEGRRRDLSSPGQEIRGRPGAGGRPLCDQFGLHQLSGRDAALRLLGAASRQRIAEHRASAAGHRPGDGASRLSPGSWSLSRSPSSISATRTSAPRSSAYQSSLSEAEAMLERRSMRSC